MAGAVTSESDRFKKAENKGQLCKSRVNDNSIRSFPTNRVYVTDCSMHELDFLVVCAPINLRYSFTVIMIILMDDQGRKNIAKSNKKGVTEIFRSVSGYNMQKFVLINVMTNRGNVLSNILLGNYICKIEFELCKIVK